MENEPRHGLYVTSAGNRRVGFDLKAHVRALANGHLQLV